MKKVISLFLIICVILSFSTSTLVSAATQYSYSPSKALEYASNHWNDGVGLCAEFVWNCVKAGGINISKKTGTRSCFNGILDNSYATRHQLKLNSSGRAMQTENSSILSPGDVVVQYCTTCDLYPHIMLFSKFDSNGNALYYAHNGAMNNGKFTLNKNSQHKSTCNIIAYVAHFPKNNSGPGQVVDEKDTPKEEKPPIITEQSSLEINITKYPETISQGDSFELSGKITSNYNVTSVIGKIIDYNGENHGTTIESPGKKSNDIQHLHLGKSMDFGRLEAGNYTLNVEVMDSSGNKKTWSKDFKVKFEEPASTLSINLRNFPSSIENGESVQLKGSITSNYSITKVEATIFDSRGFGYYHTTIYPDSKSVRIENTDLSDGICFEGLPGGTYTLEITAKDEKTEEGITKRINIAERIIEEDDDSWLYTIDTPEKFEDSGYNPIVSDEEEYFEEEKTDGVKVRVNGKQIKFDQPPIIKDGRTLVPIRAVFEALNIAVEWNGDEQKVILTKGNNQIVLTIGSRFYTNGIYEFSLDVPPQIVNGRTLLPIRAIAERFGCSVWWNDDTQTVVITSVQ